MRDNCVNSPRPKCFNDQINFSNYNIDLQQIFNDFQRFKTAIISRLTSPHNCLTSFKGSYAKKVLKVHQTKALVLI